MRFHKFSSFALLAATVIACSHKKIAVDESAQTAKKGVLSSSASWIKEKPKKFDIQVMLTNQSNKAEIVWLKDIHCSRNGLKGDVTMVDARHGDFPISLKPNVPKTLIFTCDYNREVKAGDFKFNITRVYDNPSGDGRTNGQVIAKDLVIEQETK